MVFINDADTAGIRQASTKKTVPFNQTMLALSQRESACTGLKRVVAIGILR